jgi:outer membrane protein assembly factor BamB
VKSGVSIAGEQLYVGDYSGVYALDIRSGKILWQAKAQRRFGHAGNFYGSTVAYGRVYIGATDGKVYVRRLDRQDSLVAVDGRLRLRVARGLARPRLAGSYSHRFFAFDAATGAISGSSKPNGRSRLGHGRRRRVYLRRSRDDVRSMRLSGRWCGRSPTASTRRSSPTPPAST